MNAISFGLMIPVLPNLVKSFVAGDTARAAVWTMVFGVTWGCMQFLWGPVLGSLSDRFGRRPVMLISIFGLGVDFLFMGFAPSIWWLLVGRILNGLTAASFSTANAYVADVTPPQERARRFGLMGSAFSFGFLIGPVIGGVSGRRSTCACRSWSRRAWPWPTALYGLFILPESLPPERRMARFQWLKSNPIASLGFIRAHGSMAGLSGIYFLYMMSQSVWPNVFVLYAGFRFHWSMLIIGAMLMINGALGIVVQILLVGPMVQRIGERGAVLFGATCGVIAMIVAGLADQGWIYMCCIPFAAASNLLPAGLMALMTQRVDATEQGRLQGANQSLQGITSVIGPLLYGGTFAWAVHNDATLHQPGLPVLIAAGLLAAALAIGSRVARPAPDPAFRPAE